MTTKAQAIDHLIDVLAGSDVAGGETVAGNIELLASKIEDGTISFGGGGSGGGGGLQKLTVTTSGNTNTLNASYNEIVAMVQAGTIPYITSGTENHIKVELIYDWQIDDGMYYVNFYSTEFGASSPTENMSYSNE